jgi:hypothetical protein
MLDPVIEEHSRGMRAPLIRRASTNSRPTRMSCQQQERHASPRAQEHQLCIYLHAMPCPQHTCSACDRRIMRALIFESTGTTAALVLGALPCPQHACSAYDRRGIPTIVIENAGTITVRRVILSPRHACSAYIRRDLRALGFERAGAKNRHHHSAKTCGDMICPQP